MPGNKHQNNNTSLQQPFGATKLMPLAPPALEKNNLKANFLASWLSPRVTVTGPSNSHSRRQRSQSDDDNDEDKKREHLLNMRRPRGTSLDQTHVIDGWGASGSYVGNTTSGNYLVAPSRSAEDSVDESAAASGYYRYPSQRQQNQQHQRKSGSSSGSLLTAFLLYFDALLPEYFLYFPSASDVENNGAAKAVDILERGTKRIHLHAVSPISMRHGVLSREGRHDVSSASYYDATNSPLRRSPPHNSSRSGTENSSDVDIHQQRNKWVAREKIQQVVGQVSPKHIKNLKFNSTLQAEWERFTSPFLMLVGAEVLYGEMEHVLDPETEIRLANGENKYKGDGGKDGSSSAVQFDNTKNEVESSPMSPSDSSNKRGSRRLIAMYRQVREDLVIVGEYLCDPVLGSHASIGGAVSATNSGSMMDFTPKSTFELSPESSPQKVYGRSQSQPSTPENNHTVLSSPTKKSSDERQIAARSLRSTLNALNAFIDARCVLVKIHADLCCWSSTPFSTSESSRSGNKWASLAEQCRSTMAKLSFWTFHDKDSMLQLALSKLETETKALELALLSVHHMMEYSFFNCVIHVRKLHVLLQRTTCNSVQLKWIKTSLRRILSMVKIIFYNNTNDSPLLSRSPSFLQHKANKSEEAGHMEKVFNDFIVMNENGPPLAVIVVHKCAQNECDEEVDSSPSGAPDPIKISWTPLYIKSTLDKNRTGATNAQTNPLVQMIKDNFGSPNEDKVPKAVQRSDSEREANWPFTFMDWSQIEKKLTTHAENKTRTYNVSSSPIKRTTSELQKSTKPTISKSNRISKCHIIRITEAISIIAVQGSSHRTKERLVSSLENSLDKLAFRFRPENIFSAITALQAKTSITPRSNQDDNSTKSALWSGIGWSDIQRKQVLHSLGLLHSPAVSAPLKSPYVRRQMSRMRQRKKKKKKNSLNNGHLAFFLGELSHLI